MAKKFFFVCAGLFMLALSYHFGASNAQAQFGGSVTGVTFTSGGLVLVTSTGDVYSRQFDWYNGLYGEIRSNGNFWSGAPTSATPQSWGSVKVGQR